MGNTLLHTCSHHISRYLRVVFLVLRLYKALCNIQSIQISYIFYLSFHVFASKGIISFFVLVLDFTLYGVAQHIIPICFGLTLLLETFEILIYSFAYRVHTWPDTAEYNLK